MIQASDQLSPLHNVTATHDIKAIDEVNLLLEHERHQKSQQASDALDNPQYFQYEEINESAQPTMDQALGGSSAAGQQQSVEDDIDYTQVRHLTSNVHRLLTRKLLGNALLQ